MATFSELEDRVRFITDQSGFKLPINVTLILREAENIFIRRTFCTETQCDINVSAPNVSFSGTATAISFVKGSGGTRDTISDSGSKFISSGFKPGQMITISGSTSNDGVYTIQDVTAGTLTLTSIGRLTSENGVVGMTIVSNVIPYFISLPSDFVTPIRVEYRGTTLSQLNMLTDAYIVKSDGNVVTGSPCYYWTTDSYIQLIPKPTQSGILRLWYCYYNTDENSTSPIIPTIDHMKLIDYALYTIYEMKQDAQLADRYFIKFNDNCERAKVWYAQRRYRQRVITDTTEQQQQSTLDAWINIVKEG